MSLTKKIDFAIIISVKNANPNGDPINDNRPRTNYDGYGEISDVCLKRKIRNRLMDSGIPILVQSYDYRNDEFHSIKDRYESIVKSLPKTATIEERTAFSCRAWFDVRAFGQVLAGVDSTFASIAIRGPVSIQSAFSLEPVDVSSMQITKSVNLKTDTDKDPSQKSSDTMGMKHRVERGVYVTFGSINRQLAEKTGFTDEDALILKSAMCRMFENDESSARPAGSMEVKKVIWWTHTGVVLSSSKVHGSIKVIADGSYTIVPLDGIALEELDGF